MRSPRTTSIDGLLRKFGYDFPGKHSDIMIVHQLRASAAIQDDETKRRTGWADTSDRASLMRKAADVIEALATRTPAPSLGEVERIARAICVSQGQDPDDIAPSHLFCGPSNEPLPMWQFYEEQAEAALTAMRPEADQ